jgi:hypothetical protein
VNPRPADDGIAWLDQATKVRDEALRLLHDRFLKDLERATELVGPRKSTALALQAEYAEKLTADYLAESERQFKSMRKRA